uniref:MULE domain-containing protein n=1 Tax=Heterorhabditis bacteriophora TaxID=37862 RepID=A0A1I7WCU7_HETBA
MIESLAVGYGAGPNTLRRTIQRNRDFFLGLYNASKYHCVTDEEDLLLKDNDNVIIVASHSLSNNIFVVLNLVNPFGGGLFKQIPRKAHETGSPQLYTVMMEVNGGYCLPIFFAFIRDAKRTTYEDVFGFLGMLIESLRTQASLISPGVKFIANFEVQAMDTIKATLGVLVLGCHFYYAQCINPRANVLHFGKVLEESAALGTFFRRLQMLPFMPPHLVGLSSALEPSRTPVVDVETERFFNEFMLTTGQHGFL